MADLRLGPVLRYVDESSATVWVESSRPCAAEVRCADGAGGTSDTFSVAGHHYALVTVTGLRAGTDTPYEVLLDGHPVWPLTDDRFPASTIRTLPEPGDGGESGIRSGNGNGNGNGNGIVGRTGSGGETQVRGGLRVAFGSCRWAAPPAEGHDRVGPDALDTLAARIAADPAGDRPDVLLLLGDQVYADETSEPTQAWLAARRDLGVAPGTQVADFEEYTQLYYESWLDPEVRWLLSTVPSLMIFDDHDVIDDWNTSAAWLAHIRAQPWWSERVLSGFMTYWVYQHLGNLGPAQLKNDPVYAAVCATPDGTAALRSFAARADARVAPHRDAVRESPAEGLRWSFRRDFGRVRLIMIDTRAARILQEDQRAMLGPAEAQWLREQILDGTDEPHGLGVEAVGAGGYDHLLVATSLPWLLPHLVHDAEIWNAALCRGARGGPDGRWAGFGEKVRQAADLEHWAAFPESFTELSELLREAADGPAAPATVCVLSGDVHHAYVAEPSWPDRQPAARVLQLTCSPVHNSVPAYMKAGFRFGWSAVGRVLGRLLRRHGRTAPATVNWRRTGGPWFGNHLMTLALHGRSAELTLETARTTGRRGGKGDTPHTRLVTVEKTRLT
ncbi:alkaline phosphatase D family protein [Streptomyces sp. NA04227]|uniref:alkaline phosphatase D family protein n=1 Tax=Streptomyces sp. NA04227 TaxID=2742136 RepID=UPI0020CA87BA|nr:alkaline phosphatase D family protein [Streptomyces sp. NA04227]